MQKVEQVLSIGDSYSAGIGSNGVPDEWGFGNCSRYAGAWPVLLSEKDEWKDYGKDGKKPWLTFGPCSGNVMVDVREKMLEQGDAKNTRWMEETEWPYTPIGKPQIAVMTIAGNDVKFSGIVNDCVIRYKPKMGCDQRLASSKAILASPEFKQELRFTYAKVIAAGRQAGGADPPESFQLYGGKRRNSESLTRFTDVYMSGGYIGLFNHDDTDCDHVFWNVANGWFAYKQWLTTSLRREFNDLVDELNGIIKSVAEELGPWGAIYVDGYNQGFNNHRFCEHREPKCIHQNSYQDNDMETKIWSRFSPWYEGVHVPALNGGEGRDRANICTKNAESEEEQANIPGDTDILERIADVLVPNPEERQRMRDDPNLAPWNVSAGNWDQYDDVFEMMRDRMKLHSEPIKVKWVYDWTCRSFHPKKSGYQFFASSWMEKIKANRQESPAPAPIPEPACARAAGGPTPGGLSPFHVDAAKDAARKLCGNADYNGIRVVPQIGFGTGQTPEGIKKALGFSEITASADGQTEVTAGVSFSEDTCMGLFTWPPGKPEEAYQSCLNHFDSIIDKCDADTADAKFGGTISDVCVVSPIPPPHSLHASLIIPPVGLQSRRKAQRRKSLPNQDPRRHQMQGFQCCYQRVYLLVREHFWRHGHVCKAAHRMRCD
jgi:hypothetical protein